MSSVIRRSVLALTLAVSAACSGVEPRAASTSTSTSAIQALIGDAACDSDAQCRTIGVGAKQCGGPESYLAWSSKRTDGAALQAAVERQASASRAAAAASGIMSNCMMARDPGAFCAAADASAGAQAARRCQLRAGGAQGRGSTY